MTYNTILVETHDGVGLITLNRPDALNALSPELLGELAEALSAYDADDSIGAIVLTGSEKAFAAGADIKEMQPKGFIDVFMEDFLAAEADTILSVRKPIIAAVAGFCTRWWVRIGDALRFHHCRGYSQIRATGDQTRGYSGPWWHATFAESCR